MSAVADRYRNVSDQFTRRVEGVPEGGWDRPAPCEDWTARDVVGHLTEWLPAFFFGMWGIEAPPRPDATEDPAGAWAAVDAGIRRALDDPAVAVAERDAPMGRISFEAALKIDSVFWVGDLLKTALVALVAAEVHRAFPQLLRTPR